MAKFDLKFIDCADELCFIKVKETPTEDDKMLSEFPNGIIQISGFDNGIGEDFCIWLDKSTAIKFAKTLRTEINKITEQEVNNG